MTIKNTGDGESEAALEPGSTNNAARPEATKPLTIMLPEELLRKLKVIGVVRERSISELVIDYIDGPVKRDLKKVIGKLDA